MRLEIPDHKILVYELTHPIAWGEMDALGHVNNTVYFRYMEQARVSWITAINGTLNGIEDGPVIANAFCNFYRPLVFPGTITIRLYVANPGRTSIDTFVSIERTDDPGVVYAAGGATLVWVSLKDGRASPLPDAVRKLATTAPALPGADTPPALPA